MDSRPRPRARRSSKSDSPELTDAITSTGKGVRRDASGQKHGKVWLTTSPVVSIWHSSAAVTAVPDGAGTKEPRQKKPAAKDRRQKNPLQEKNPAVSGGAEVLKQREVQRVVYISPGTKFSLLVVPAFAGATETKQECGPHPRSARAVSCSAKSRRSPRRR